MKFTSTYFILHYLICHRDIYNNTLLPLAYHVIIRTLAWRIDTNMYVIFATT